MKLSSVECQAIMYSTFFSPMHLCVQLRELMLAAITSVKTLFGPATEEVDDTVGDPASVSLWRKLLRLTGKAGFLEFLIMLFFIQGF